MKEFILKNGKDFKIKTDIGESKVLQGVRENYYTDAELKEWIQHGQIRHFKR